MNRLQKKCLIATAGIHLLLLSALLCSGFVPSKQNPDDTKLLDVIPFTTIDAAFNSGVKNATPPPPTPVQPQPQPQPQQITTPPKPVEPTPTPSLLDKMEKLFKPEPALSKPVENQPHKIQPNLTKVTRTNVKPIPNPALKNTIANLKNKLSKSTVVDMPGDSSVSYANYASVVRSIYDAAWTLPDSIANEDENTKVTVTIANDGTVIFSRIVTPSGDAILDASVQKVLDRVKFVKEFPEGSADKERTYTINFNPQIKSLSE